jgi:NADPH:quinone reductase-like Zn-dependent oxidoreductase
VPSSPPLHAGTFAEYVVRGADLVLARKPGTLPFTVAAAIPLASSTALDCVDAVDLGPGETVVIAGATGGVGSVAVQLASQRGATVIATAKPGDEDVFVSRLGAADSVDYNTGDVVGSLRSRYPDGVSALIDTVNRGGDFARMAELVRDGGRVSTTLGAADVEVLAARNVRATNVVGTPTAEKLAWLADQVVAGTLKIHIQRTLPFADVSEALTAFSAGTLGKIVLEI